MESDVEAEDAQIKVTPCKICGTKVSNYQDLIKHKLLHLQKSTQSSSSQDFGLLGKLLFCHETSISKIVDTLRNITKIFQILNFHIK